MVLLLRLVEYLAYVLFVVWTMIFPLATLLSLSITLPLMAWLGRPPMVAEARRPARALSMS